MPAARLPALMRCPGRAPGRHSGPPDEQPSPRIAAYRDCHKSCEDGLRWYRNGCRPKCSITQPDIAGRRLGEFGLGTRNKSPSFRFRSARAAQESRESWHTATIAMQPAGQASTGPIEYRASYRPSIYSVYMPARSCFEDAPHFYSTLFNELVHGSGHENAKSRTCSLTHSYEFAHYRWPDC
jgi:hypothetical protein